MNTPLPYLLPAFLAFLTIPSAVKAELSQIDLSGLAASRAIAGTTAAGSPSAYQNRGPIYAFNGAGLSGTTHGTAANYAMFMLSSNNSGTFPWYIQVDLGEVKRLDAVRLYNFNFAANGNTYTVRGPKNFKLYVSTEGSWLTAAAAIQTTYKLVLSDVLPQASGTDAYQGEYFTLDKPVNARFVALVALDDYDDEKENLNYNGISEIQLFSGGEPLEEGPPDPNEPVIVDNSDPNSVVISGTWSTSSHNAERYGADYLHSAKAASEDLWVRYTPTLPTNAFYKVSLFWNGDNTRGSAIPVEIVHADGVATNYVDMTVPSDTWNMIGAWRFAAGSSGSVRIMTIGQEDKYVIADAVKFEIATPGAMVLIR